MSLDAVWALGDVSHCHGNQLLGLGRQGAVCKDALTEGVERGLDIGSKLASLVRELLR
jgi:hypothetical protein